MADRLPPIQIGRIDPCEFWFGVDAGAHDLFSGELYLVVTNQSDPQAARRIVEGFFTAVVAGRECHLVPSKKKPSRRTP